MGILIGHTVVCETPPPPRAMFELAWGLVRAGRVAGPIEQLRFQCRPSVAGRSEFSMEEYELELAETLEAWNKFGERFSIDVRLGQYRDERLDTYLDEMTGFGKPWNRELTLLYRSPPEPKQVMITHAESGFALDEDGVAEVRIGLALDFYLDKYSTAEEPFRFLRELPDLEPTLRRSGVDGSLREYTWYE